jgi:hypothetical protein
MSEQPRVYVSHAPQDGPYALRLVQRLLERGAAVWTNDAATGADAPGMSTQANIQACDWFIVIQTPDAAASPLVRAEIAAALAAHQHQPRHGLIAFIAAPGTMPLPPGFARVDAVRLGYDAALQAACSRIGLADSVHVATGLGRGLTRRALLLGLGAAGTAALAAGGFVTLRALRSATSSAVTSPTSVVAPGYLAEGKLLVTYSGHSDKIFMVAWAPDEVRAASASQDQTAQVWRADTGRRLVIYRDHLATVASVAWAHHSDRIASASYDMTVRIWDAATGRTRLTYTRHTAALNAARWSHDDTRIASAGIDGVQVWEVATGRRIWASAAHTSLSDVAWSPDGHAVAVASFLPTDRTVTILDATTGAVKLTYRAHPDDIFSIAWSPNGRMIASTGASGVVRVWEPRTGATITTFAGNAGSVTALAWSHDSRALASGGGDSGGIGDTRVLVWEVATGQILCTYSGHPRYVNSADWSPDDTRIVSGSDDHTAQVWQVRQG